MTSLMIATLVVVVAEEVYLHKALAEIEAEETQELTQVTETEPREVMIVIDYSNWDRERIQQEILEQLPPVFLEVAECESETKQYVDGTDTPITGYVDSRDTGVFQINKGYHAAEAKRLGLDLDTPVGNIAYAKYLYETQGLQPWSASKPCWG